MTLQVPDNLIYEGQTYYLFDYPSIPLIDEKIVERTDPKGLIHSTACSRGYISVWEIRDNQIFLKDVKGCYEKLCEEDIFAHWMSRSLNAKTGDRIPTVLSLMTWPLSSIEKTIEVERGVINSVSTKDNLALCDQIESLAKQALVGAKKEIASRPFNIFSYIEGCLPWRKSLRDSTHSEDRSNTLLKHMEQLDPSFMSKPASLELFRLTIVADELWEDPEYSLRKGWGEESVLEIPDFLTRKSQKKTQ
jgi:hypothetical protein